MQDLLQQFSTNFPILFAICKWLLIGLGLGAFAFCFNHYVKGVFIDKRCKPILRFQNTKDKSIYLTRFEELNIEATIKEKLSREATELMKQYPKKNLDPYKNPFLAVDNDMAVASKMYNIEVDKYIPAKLCKLEQELRFNALSEYLEKISFSIENNGSLTTKNAVLKVFVSSTGPKVYQNTIIEELVGNIPETPSYTPEYGMANLLVPPTNKQYKYYKIDFSNTSTFKDAELDIPDIVPGIPDVNTFQELYVDKRTLGTVTIHWNIHESTMKAKGVEGVLTINIV